MSPLSRLPNSANASQKPAKVTASRKGLGLWLSILLSVAGPGAYGSDFPVPEGSTRVVSGFEQTLGFPNLFIDTGNATAVLSELRQPIPESAFSSDLLPLISSVDRSYFNLLGTLQSHHDRDNRGNTYAVVQSAPLTRVHTRVQGSGNQLNITQTGHGAHTALHLTGNDNQVRILQAGPETKVKMAIKADTAYLSVQQRSEGATLILQGQIGVGGRLSIMQ